MATKLHTNFLQKRQLFFSTIRGRGSKTTINLVEIQSHGNTAINYPPTPRTNQLTPVLPSPRKTILKNANFFPSTKWPPEAAPSWILKKCKWRHKAEYRRNRLKKDFRKSSGAPPRYDPAKNGPKPIFNPRWRRGHFVFSIFFPFRVHHSKGQF